MQSRGKIKPFAAWILVLLIAVSCLPVSAMGEAAGDPEEGIRIEVLPEETAENNNEQTSEGTSPDRTDNEINEPLGADDCIDSGEENLSAKDQQDSIPASEETLPDSGFTEDEIPEEDLPGSDNEPPAEDESPEQVNQEESSPATAESDSTLSDESSEPSEQSTDESSPEADSTPTESAVPEQSSESTETENLSLQAAIEKYGHVYVMTTRPARIFESPALKADTLIYTADSASSLLLATFYTAHDTVVIWFLDEDENVVNGFISAKDVDSHYLLDEDIRLIGYIPAGEGATAIGIMKLFIADGAYAAAEEAPVTEPVEESENEEPLPYDETYQEETPYIIPEEEIESDQNDLPDESGLTSEEEKPPFDPDEPMIDETSPDLPDDETESVIPDIVPEDSADGDKQLPETEEPDNDPSDLIGSFVQVTAETRAFSTMNPDAAEKEYTDQYLGHFVKEAAVQILSVDHDENGSTWYQVRYLYGDVSPIGKLRWSDHGSVWILQAETEESDKSSCTLTDYAYTREYLQKIRSSGRKLMRATPMNGFTLKNINGPIGPFYTGQTGLHGSTGHSNYPQLARSAAHGLIYATPHYLEGTIIYCLEQRQPGPGENAYTSTGPYELIDMYTFANDPSSGGVTGVQFSESTMHALGWVLRHTYPFMVLDRDDTYNEPWSRVAGQFAIREVIKQLEGAQYVESFWKMEDFYSFTGGAPEVYLTYARWLAENGIARAGITGDIYASDQSVSLAGDHYVGWVTFTTDADLIRIPIEYGPITGNSAGSDGTFYYLKSGDTIYVESAESSFTITMESISSTSEEAFFLVGVPTTYIQKLLIPLEGTPYPLKSGSLPFELNLGAIRVIKQSADGILLAGTEFELLDRSGNHVAVSISDDSGAATFSGLSPGNYIVVETDPPQGFKLSENTFQNVTVTAGVTAEVTYVNQPILGRIRIIKTDTVTEQPLPGATFTITQLSGPDSYYTEETDMISVTVTTDAQGIAETGLLPWGEYEITETGVLDGYIDSGFTATVWIN